MKAAAAVAAPAAVRRTRTRTALAARQAHRDAQPAFGAAAELDAAAMLARHGLHDGQPEPAAFAAAGVAATEALERVLADATLRTDLRVRGLAQAARFTWRRSAEATLAVYRSALDSGSRA